MVFKSMMNSFEERSSTLKTFKYRLLVRQQVSIVAEVPYCTRVNDTIFIEIREFVHCFEEIIVVL